MSDRNPLSGINPNEIHARLVSLGEEWAEADAAASFLEETKKSLLARLSAEFGETHRSFAQAQNAALASEEYSRHIEAMVAARKAATKARVRYDGGKVWADMARSQNANRRAELAMGHLAT